MISCPAGSDCLQYCGPLALCWDQLGPLYRSSQSPVFPGGEIGGECEEFVLCIVDLAIWGHSTTLLAFPISLG